MIGPRSVAAGSPSHRLVVQASRLLFIAGFLGLIRVSVDAHISEMLPGRVTNGFRRDHFKEGMADMKYRPVIGINTDYRASAKGRTPHSFVHSGYFECLLAANALPLIIPPLTKEPDLVTLLDRVDGMMLTGGDDLDPRKMGCRRTLPSRSCRSVASSRTACFARSCSSVACPCWASGSGCRS